MRDLIQALEKKPDGFAFLYTLSTGSHFMGWLKEIKEPKVVDDVYAAEGILWIDNCCQMSLLPTGQHSMGWSPIIIPFYSTQPMTPKFSTLISHIICDESRENDREICNIVGAYVDAWNKYRAARSGLKLQ